MNIGFTGHRNKQTTIEALHQIERDYPGATWIHGGAQGFDAQVHRVALELGKVEGETLIVIKPDYKKYLPNVAPLIRNELIVKISNLIICCWDGRKKGGTYQCVNYAHKRGVTVRSVKVEEIIT